MFIRLAKRTLSLVREGIHGGLINDGVSRTQSGKLPIQAIAKNTGRFSDKVLDGLKFAVITNRPRQFKLNYSPSLFTERKF